MNILAIGAHPDDIEYGCGGMLAKYARKGHDVYLFVASDGALGGGAAGRRREQEDAARGRGQAEPRMIFVNSPDDTHQDHRHLAQCASSATRYVPNFLFYEVPSTLHFAPNCYTDIADVLDTKLAGLEAPRSQVTKTSIEDLTILELARSCANFRGIQERGKYAEAFQSVRLLLNL